MEARRATLGDVEEIVRLAGLMFRSMEVDVEQEGWPDAAERTLRERLGDDVMAVVVDGPDGAGRLVASGAGSLHRRLPRPGVPTYLAGYVQWVATDPAHRGQGLASDVMLGLLDWFEEQGVRSVELHATEMAESVYERLGFESSGGRPMRIRDLAEWRRERN